MEKVDLTSSNDQVKVEEEDSYDDDQVLRDDCIGSGSEKDDSVPFEVEEIEVSQLVSSSSVDLHNDATTKRNDRLTRKRLPELQEGKPRRRWSC